jgi:hypothetical protein
MEILEQMMRSGRCHLSLGRYYGAEWNALCVLKDYPEQWHAKEVQHVGRGGSPTWTTWTHPYVPARFYLYDWRDETRAQFEIKRIRKRAARMFGHSAESYDVWFTGPDGYLWYGRGDNWVNCKRLVMQDTPPHMWGVSAWGTMNRDSARYKKRSAA